jgi:hypothetical protein
MLLKYFIFVMLGCIFFLQKEVINAQSVKNKSYVLSMSGASKNIKLQGASYSIQQSVGQQGITGTFKKNKTVLIQGFLHPRIIAPQKNELSDLDVTLRVIPNSQMYNVIINSDIQSGFFVKLYDLTGKNIYSRFYTNEKSFELNMELFVTGVYILNINTSTKKFSTKLIK